MHITVRVATDADVDVLAGLRRRWDEEEAGATVDDAGFDERFASWLAMERDTRTFFVVEADGVAVGMANVKRYNRMPFPHRAAAGWWGYVGNVFVLADYRNRGVGRALMDQLIAWAGEARMEHLRLAPSARSEPFYARLGFVPGAVVELDPPLG